ncbi:MAG: WD40/YVTN/BNR-like repeat-containing protein [Myxococcaceae bacterium]
MLSRPWFLLPLCALLLSCSGGLKRKHCGGAFEPCCESAGCNEGFACGADNLCSACGGPEQRCCAGAVCHAGNLCGASSTCVPCGAEGQECCAGTPCGPALACQGNQCVKAVVCVTTCTIGQKRCTSGNGIEVCALAGACPEWSVVIASCPSGSDCIGAAGQASCEERCPGACVPDTRLCTVAGLKQCKLATGASCPAYQPALDNTDKPACVTGAVETSFQWESPTPQGNDLVSIAGWGPSQYFVLDDLGNVLRNDAAGWTYELRATTQPHLRALGWCDMPAPVLLAVGDNGTVRRRSNGAWLTDDVGDPTAQLSAVACDSSLRAVAVGAGGKIFVRAEGLTGTWRAVASGTTVSLRGVGYDSFHGAAYAVGALGTVLRCAPVYTPASVTCAAEPAAASVTLSAAWANAMNDEAYAVGAGGVILRRVGTSWNRVAPTLLSADLSAVHGYYDPAALGTPIFVAGAAGAFGSLPSGATWFDNTFSAEPLTGVMALDSKNLFAIGPNGAIWFSDNGGFIIPPMSGWVSLGGKQPTRADLQAVAGTGPLVLAVGSGGARLSRTDEAWREEASPAVSQDLFGATVVSAQEAYAVGDVGMVLGRRSGAWAVEAAGVTTAPLFAAFNDGQRVFAVGGQGVWLEKPVAHSGTTWARLPQGLTTQTLRAISGEVSAGGGSVEITAVGDGCTMLHQKAGAFTLETIPGCAGDALTAVWQGPGGELYVGGEGALVMHRIGGVWSREYLGLTLERVNAIAVSGSTAWAACDSGELYRRTAGTWRQEAEKLSTTFFKGVSVHPTDGVYVVGSGGLIWRRP